MRADLPLFFGRFPRLSAVVCPLSAESAGRSRALSREHETPRPSGLPTYPPAKQPEGATRRGAFNAEATEFRRHGDGRVILLCQHPPRRPPFFLSFSVPHLLRFLRVQRRRHVAQGRGATREHERGSASRRGTKMLPRFSRPFRAIPVLLLEQRNTVADGTSPSLPNRRILAEDSGESRTPARASASRAAYGWGILSRPYPRRQQEGCDCH